MAAESPDSGSAQEPQPPSKRFKGKAEETFSWEELAEVYEVGSATFQATETLHQLLLLFIVPIRCQLTCQISLAGLAGY